jgi:hypothetical protein
MQDFGHGALHGLDAISNLVPGAGVGIAGTRQVGKHLGKQVAKEPGRLARFGRWFKSLFCRRGTVAKPAGSALQEFQQGQRMIIGFIDKRTGKVVKGWADDLQGHTVAFWKLQDAGRIPKDANLGNYIGFTIIPDPKGKAPHILRSGSSPGFRRRQ